MNKGDKGASRPAASGGYIEIVDYDKRYQEAFRRLNEAWITAHWHLEPHDIEVFNDPERLIIAPGGHIFVALLRGEAVGVCALCRRDAGDYDYELAKLAVLPSARGLGIGFLLCKSVVDKARSLGGRGVFIESNTLLRPALRVYEKLGFEPLAKCRPSYSRGDIQLALRL